MPIILIGISISIFFVFANPLFNDIKSLNAKAESYNDALSNSKMLENERDKLTAKYNAIDPENLRRLEKFLPENVDNIRLILEIEQIASPYGMTLKDVKYNTSEESSSKTSQTTILQEQNKKSNKDYGVFDLEFSTSGSYNDFINFTRDLENNLRIVDISSVGFSSNLVSALGGKTEPSGIYKYDFKIKTYWLKN
jgi:Tfp pilus assembly protein PilO